MKKLASVVFLALLGCGTARVMSPAATFLLSVDHYRAQLRDLEKKPDRWPERQELAQWLKGQYLVRFGRSAEFEQLVDLDAKKRELLIALRDSQLAAERAAEIKTEIARITTELENLKRPVVAQLEAAELRVPREPSQALEAIAAIGLAAMSVEALASGTLSRAAPPTINLAGKYSVTDYGPFAAVKTPDGQIHRCALVLLDEGVAGVRCGKRCQASNY
ncbi:MAG TPA: hypothetical protein VNL14_22615 [Candidatus Acidoferrales bacterium]|nr:hypothetical protein [Candidatus Acidoferrales bacterium]